jgi:hypothetical protein
VFSILLGMTSNLAGSVYSELGMEIRPNRRVADRSDEKVKYIIHPRR